jgi:hypothetical protein
MTVYSMITDTYFWTLNGSKTVASQFHVNVTSRQVIDNDHVVALITQVKSRRPSAKAVAAQDNDLFLVLVGSTISVRSSLSEQSRVQMELSVADNSISTATASSRKGRRGHTLDRRKESRAGYHKDRTHEEKLHHGIDII